LRDVKRAAELAEGAALGHGCSSTRSGIST
jgi:hypothetical protein